MEKVGCVITCHLFQFRKVKKNSNENSDIFATFLDGFLIRP